jgi:hypothetical protein
MRYEYMGERVYKEIEAANVFRDAEGRSLSLDYFGRIEGGCNQHARGRLKLCKAFIGVVYFRNKWARDDARMETFRL